MRLSFTFQRGGVLNVSTLAGAPKTVEAVRAELPIEAKVFQARWSGKESFVPVNFRKKPPRENQSIRASLGDVIYFSEWSDSYNYTGFEAIGFFYGPEIIREWRGDAPANVFGRIDPQQFDLLLQIGERVWREGGEGISIRVIGD
ncbi:MAG: DUF3830 family protein [Alphaproteobacteria bacterium]|nr:DUF3830 family protein [Alphaproteobacteria bacterium]